MLNQFWVYLDGLGWLLLMLGPLLFAQRWLHREIQILFLLLTRKPVIALGLFSLLFFPGVLLHELSHYLVDASVIIDCRQSTDGPRLVVYREEELSAGKRVSSRRGSGARTRTDTSSKPKAKGKGRAAKPRKR